MGKGCESSVEVDRGGGVGGGVSGDNSFCYCRRCILSIVAAGHIDEDVARLTIHLTHAMSSSTIVDSQGLRSRYLG